MKKIFLAAVITVINYTAYSGGSTYSRYGFGDILYYGDSRLFALGGTGIALIDDSFINGFNPAGTARITSTRFSLGFEYNYLYSTDRNTSGKYSLGRLQGLSFAFPISKDNGIVLSAEFNPYSSVSYSVRTSVEGDPATSPQDIKFYGKGGLSHIGLGISASPSNALHIGAKLNYIYGSIRQYQTYLLYSYSYFDRSAFFSGFSFTIGGIYEHIGDIINLPSLEDASIGSFVTTSATLDVDEYRTYPNIGYYGYDSTFSRHGTAQLPLTFGVGVSYPFKNFYRIVGDFVYDKWKSTKYFDAYQADLRNSFRISAGFEISPSKDVYNYWKRLFYRFGLAYNATYYNIHNIGINEFLVSGGLGFPFGQDSRLNVALQIGLRGTVNDNLQKDTIVRLSVGITTSEIWFRQIEED
jgi:hypothetical protein